MSNDLNDEDLNLDDSFDSFEKKGGSTLGELWNSNPMIKIGAVVGGAILIFMMISFFSNNDGPVQESYVDAAPDVTSTPGTQEASPAYVDAIKEINDADLERAINEGTSALPVPIEPPVGIVAAPEDAAETEDPLQRWRRLQEERLQREIQQRDPVEAEAVDTGRQEAIQALSDLMATQMTSILQTQSEVQLKSMSLTDPNFLENLHQQELQEAAAAAAASAPGQLPPEVLFPAGQIVYAQLITEANTDAPGPVLAEIMSGPLKGNRVLGTFAEEKELLTLNFDTIVVDDESLSISAVALDPGTTLPAMATDVDHHYLKRIVLPAAAAFVEGMAGALGQTESTVVVVDGGTSTEDTEEPNTEQEVAIGIEEAGAEIREILDDITADIETTVIIASGTPIGILFLEPVIKNPPVNVPPAAGTPPTTP